MENQMLGKSGREEQSDLFTKDSTLYWNSIVEQVEKLGGKVSIYNGEISFPIEVKMSGGLPMLNEVVLPWTYDTYRILNLALQGLEWFNWLNKELQVKRSLMSESEKKIPMIVPSITEMICERIKKEE